MLGYFAGRNDEISESAAQLAHFRKVMRSAGTPATKASQGGDPFLSGTEERVVSADLQASLKSIASNTGVNLLGVRGVPGRRHQQLRLVAVRVELEGSLAAVRDMMLTIGNQTPFLFVTASLRSVGEGDDGPIRAELKIEGAMRDGGPSSATEAGANERAPISFRINRRVGRELTRSLASSPGYRCRLARRAASWLAVLLGRTELPAMIEIAALRPATRALLAGFSGWIALVLLVTLVAIVSVEMSAVSLPQWFGAPSSTARGAAGRLPASFDNIAQRPLFSRRRQGVSVAPPPVPLPSLPPMPSALDRDIALKGVFISGPLAKAFPAIGAIPTGRVGSGQRGNLGLEGFGGSARSGDSAGAGRKAEPAAACRGPQLIAALHKTSGRTGRFLGGRWPGARLTGRMPPWHGGWSPASFGWPLACRRTRSGPRLRLPGYIW